MPTAYAAFWRRYAYGIRDFFFDFQVAAGKRRSSWKRRKAHRERLRCAGVIFEPEDGFNPRGETFSDQDDGDGEKRGGLEADKPERKAESGRKDSGDREQDGAFDGGLTAEAGGRGEADKGRGSVSKSDGERLSVQDCNDEGAEGAGDKACDG